MQALGYLRAIHETVPASGHQSTLPPGDDSAFGRILDRLREEPSPESQQYSQASLTDADQAAMAREEAVRAAQPSMEDRPDPTKPEPASGQAKRETANEAVNQAAGKAANDASSPATGDAASFANSDAASFANSDAAAAKAAAKAAGQAKERPQGQTKGQPVTAGQAALKPPKLQPGKSDNEARSGLVAKSASRPDGADLRATQGKSAGKAGLIDRQTAGRTADRPSQDAVNSAAMLSLRGPDAQINGKPNPGDKDLKAEREPAGLKTGAPGHGEAATVRVVDLRLKTGRGDAAAERRQGDQAGQPGAGRQAEGAAADGLRLDAAGREHSGPPSFEASLNRAAGADSSPAPTSLAENLAARIRDSGAADIVKAAQIVLKDADSGMIRLRLDPESLGSVKIELKIADKKISGRIIVESDLAGRAFKDSLESLRDAFSASGLETSALEVEVRHSQQEAGQGRGESQAKEPFFSQRLKELDAAVPAAVASASADGLLNIIV